MNGLVPEKRQDCNGRIVTRWVKPSLASSAPTPPAATVRLGPERDCGEIGIGMAALLWGDMDSWSLSTGRKLNPRDLRRLFGRLPYSSLCAVERSLGSLGEADLGVAGRVLANACSRWEKAVEPEELVEASMHYSAELAPVVNAFCDEADDLSYRSDAVANIATFMKASSRASFPALLLADDRERAIARALAANLALTGDFGTLDDEELHWIGENLHRLLPYREALQERGPIRRAEAELILSTPTGSLASGIL